jgi:hypothetical protein
MSSDLCRFFCFIFLPINIQTMKTHLLLFLSLITIISCGNPQPEEATEQPETTAAKTIGKVERMLPELDAVLDANAKIEVLAEGYTWSEGPLWVDNEGFLLFTDVPVNKIYKRRLTARSLVVMASPWMPMAAWSSASMATVGWQG